MTNKNVIEHFDRIRTNAGMDKVLTTALRMYANAEDKSGDYVDVLRRELESGKYAGTSLLEWIPIFEEITDYKYETSVEPTVHTHTEYIDMLSSGFYGSDMCFYQQELLALYDNYCDKRGALSALRLLAGYTVCRRNFSTPKTIFTCLVNLYNLFGEYGFSIKPPTTDVAHELRNAFRDVKGVIEASITAGEMLFVLKEE